MYYIILAVLLLIFSIIFIYLFFYDTYEHIHYPIRYPNFIDLYRAKKYKSKNLYIDKSTYDLDGVGLFTKKNIAKGDIVYVHTNDTDDCLSSYMNDTDFVYPKKWTYEKLAKSFKNYTKKSKCNLDIYHNDDITIFKANKNIKKGEELTKRYGLHKWCCFLMAECLGSKMSQLRKNIVIDSNFIKFNILRDVAKEYGISVSNIMENAKKNIN
jgi:hypothetical protein